MLGPCPQRLPKKWTSCSRENLKASPGFPEPAKVINYTGKCRLHQDSRWEVPGDGSPRWVWSIHVSTLLKKRSLLNIPRPREYKASTGNVQMRNGLLPLARCIGLLRLPWQITSNWGVCNNTHNTVPGARVLKWRWQQGHALSLKALGAGFFFVSYFLVVARNPWL